jgi:uncharacterized membrane protein YkoI
MTAVAVFVLAAPVRADEEKVPLDKVPKAVLEAAKKRFPKAEVVGASKETADGKTVYEVELKEAGKTIDVTLTPEGVITTIEQQIDAKDLPKPVAEALEKKYPKATYKLVEAVYAVKDGKEALDFYEAVLVTADKKEIEVQVLADGKIKNEEEKKPEKKEEKKGDLPKPVADAVKSKFPGTKVVSAEKEDEDGKTVYEIKLKAKGAKLETVLTEKGEILKVKVKGEDDEKGEKGEKGKSSGFQGEQKGQNEDKGDTKGEGKKGKKKGDRD